MQLAIVGAGAIGVAMATRLGGRVGRIALIEAGTTKFEPASGMEFFRAQQVDDSRHAPIELYRRRVLGGTTTVWGGRCIPFDEDDFAPAPGRAGWPIGFTELAPHVAEALHFLEGGTPDFSADTALPRHPIAYDRSAGRDLCLDRIERYSRPTNVWKLSREALARAKDILVIKGAACTNVLASANGCVEGIELKTAANRSHRVAARMVVLACGGLETPRLLLASRGTLSCGLGNEHDLVGRCYMTHLVSSASNVGMLRFAHAEAARAFDFNMTTDGIYGRRMILLAPEARRRQAIPNIVFRPNRPAMDDASHCNAILSAMFMVRSFLIPQEYARSLARNARGAISSRVQRAHVANILGGLPSLAGFSLKWLTRRVLATRKLPSVFIYNPQGRYPLEFNAEQLPNPESRVLLGGEVDPFGVPRLIVRWTFHDSEIDAICRAYAVLQSAIAASGLGTVEFEDDVSAAVRRALVPQGGHHIGTVRMGENASSGVVDSHCEVWGVRGLFLAGTGVLPTSGYANPTLMAVALALRLAEHIARRSAMLAAA